MIIRRGQVCDLAVESHLQQVDDEVVLEVIPIQEVGLARIRILAPKGAALVYGDTDLFLFSSVDLSNWAASVSRKVLQDYKSLLLKVGVKKSSPYYKDMHFAPANLGGLSAKELYCPLSAMDELARIISEAYECFKDKFYSATPVNLVGRSIDEMPLEAARWLIALSSTDLASKFRSYQASLAACEELVAEYYRPDAGLFRLISDCMDLSLREFRLASSGCVDFSSLSEDMKSVAIRVKCLRAFLMRKLDEPYFHSIVRKIVRETSDDPTMIEVSKEFSVLLQDSGEMVSWSEILQNYLEDMEGRFALLSYRLQLEKGAVG